MLADLRDELLAMAEEDLATRARLAADGSLFQGYHSEMEAVHTRNAARFEALIRIHGWPGRAQVGAEAAEAAWLIVQHAISLPAFQRACLDHLQRGDAPAWQPAMLLDRIRVLEGKPQRFGTQFDWDEAGQLSPLPIKGAEGVDARRAAIGLPPLAEAIREHRARNAGEPPPADAAKRRREAEEWAIRTGWREP